MITSEQRAKAHVDLEQSICGVADMASVCRVLMEYFRADIGKTDPKQFSNASMVALIQAARAAGILRS